MRNNVTFREALGLSEWSSVARDVQRALGGDGVSPPTRFDLSSLRIVQPRLALRTWLGVTRSDRRAPLYNLFNHHQPPVGSGWSVRVTDVCDFAGHAATYDSHNGTDFAVPVGTIVVAACAGRVMRVSNEFDRGATKVFLDHGEGLFTSYAHLARALVSHGQFVRRGEPIAYSGMAGLDGVAMFPWNAPHIHFNTWLDSVPIDPFARGQETSLWRSHNDPLPCDESEQDEQIPPTDWDFDALEELLQACMHEPTRITMKDRPRDEFFAADMLFYRNYYPARFRSHPTLYRSTHARTPRLTLPLRASDFVGVAMPEGRGW